MSAFCTAMRRSHFLKFASTLTDGQKALLLASDPFQKELFDPKVLSEVQSQFASDAATRSHVDLSQAVAKGLLGKRSGNPPSSGAGSSGGRRLCLSSCSAWWFCSFP